MTCLMLGLLKEMTGKMQATRRRRCISQETKTFPLDVLEKTSNLHTTQGLVNSHRVHKLLINVSHVLALIKGQVLLLCLIQLSNSLFEFILKS